MVLFESNILINRFFLAKKKFPQSLHDLMTKLFEEPSSNHYHSLNVNKTNLVKRYTEALQLLDKFNTTLSI